MPDRAADLGVARELLQESGAGAVAVGFFSRCLGQVDGGLEPEPRKVVGVGPGTAGWPWSMNSYCSGSWWVGRDGLKDV